MLNRFFLYTVLTSLILFYSCKDEPTIVTQLTRTEILTGSEWKLQTAYATGTNEDITKSFSIKRILFKKDGSFDIGWAQGTWKFTGNESKIVLSQPGLGETECNILELNSGKVVISLTVLGAGKVTYIPAPPMTRDPLVNFDSLWTSFDALYSFFEIKHINWDSLRSVYRQQVTGQTTEQQLFIIMSSLLSHLKDGHVSLLSSFGSYAYTDWYSKYPANYLGTGAITKYFTKDYGTNAGEMIRYGRISDSIGYIYIGPNFKGNVSAWSEAIDAILDSIADVHGFIVDVRSNGGGNDMLSSIIASRFADMEHIYSYTRVRNGPNHNDFTGYESHTIEPLGKRQFNGPVTLLTNRRCFSSTEAFILMMKTLPNVTSIGDTSGGGSANPQLVDLPNGWQIRISRWIQYTSQKTIFEGIGLPPDIPVQISTADSIAGRDVILERAVRFLSE